MEFVYDLETTGLPTGLSWNKFPDYKQLDKYASSRIVSISWIVSCKHRAYKQAYFIVKPEGFIVSEESTKIHGISYEQAVREGIPLAHVLEMLKDALSLCTSLVAHNIAFDSNVLKSELYRHGEHELVEKLNSMHEICTMKKGKEVMKSKKNPKLGELYKHLYGEDMENAHNAQYDTLYCYKCFTKMFPKDTSIFIFGDRVVKLTPSQMEVVYEHHDKNMLVIACAGSGKTVSMLCRIKHMIDEGVPENSIMVTTFTRDAANDMKNKLFDILGYKPKVNCGTIDSISKMYVERYASSCSKAALKDVGEYNYLFLRAIQNDPAIIAKYKYLFVDEFQDINEVQYQIIREFYKQGCVIYAVGDDAQNIYTFRGSSIKYILHFAELFDNAVTKYLIHNFRSSASIIDMANACIEKNESSIPKVMIQGNMDLPEKKPMVQYFPTKAAHNTQVLHSIQSLLSDGVAEHDICVICPINHPLFLIEELLTKNNIHNVYLDGKCDVKTSKKPWHVCLCTIHKSKGLEWDYVFIVGASDEILPKMKTPSSVEESRRLFYVAITRARKELYVYYHVMMQEQPFVTRYISELDKRLYDTVNMSSRCYGKSELECVPFEKSVTKLLENLDGSDYIFLREHGILPNIDKSTIPKRKLYQGFKYESFIEKNELYSDFGIFIEKYINKQLAVVLNKPELAKDKHALLCLSNVKLNAPEYIIYCQYRNNFKTNMQHSSAYLSNIHGNWHIIKRVLEQHAKFIQESHSNTIKYILGCIKQKADEYKVSPHEVPVFSMTFLPEDFEKKMQNSLMCYRDMNHSDNIVHTWEVAKCNKIVTEYRRRLLYLNVDLTELSKYEPLFTCINTNLMDFLVNKVKDREREREHEQVHEQMQVHVNKSYDMKDDMSGEIDLLIDNTIIDFKNSINDDISIQWILQLLCYKVLYDFCSGTGKRIEHIGILNPLQGWYVEIDVREWNKHHELVTYLLHKRDIKLAAAQA